MSATNTIKNAFVGFSTSVYTIPVILIAALLSFVFPLMFFAADDNPKDSTTLDQAKKNLEVARRNRILASVFGCLFVIVPLCIKAFADIHYAIKK